MVDVDLLEQLVHAMEDAIVKLEEAFKKGDLNYINRLRVFIFNIHQQINSLLIEVLNGGLKMNIKPSVEVSQRSGVGGEVSSDVSSATSRGGKNV